MYAWWNMHVLLCALVAAGGCARSRLGVDGRVAPPNGGPGVEITGGAGASAPSAGGFGGSDQPMRPAEVGAPGGPFGGQSGGWDAGGTSGGAAPGVDAPVGPPRSPSDSGSPAPDNPNATDVLNPQRCAVDEPFVLSIDPGGGSGHVQGWLESAPAVMFDAHDLPRFGVQSGPEGDTDGELSLWWSINELSADGSGALWFYPGNAATEVVHVPVQRPSAIGDATMLSYEAWSVGPVAVGEMAVFHHIPSDRYVAVRATDMYGTESARRELCAAIDATWTFAPLGTGDFSDGR